VNTDALERNVVLYDFLMQCCLMNHGPKRCVYAELINLLTVNTTVRWPVE
jgi:hypothetical protein